ncbi:hypothetical protein ABZW18_30750 [Streptomyces sp. NPDC004647]|uniref:hypothetical protein n=1 Tax=Streptomyces sp. NPDC004647 TaxID=3154671 RepID=UPI0033B1B7EF
MEVQTFLQQLTEKQLLTRKLRLSVDLVPRPGLVTKEIEQLDRIVRIEVTLRLPNSWLKKSGNLRPLIKKMHDWNADTSTVGLGNESDESGLTPPSEEVESLDEEASRGDAIVILVSADHRGNREIFDSTRHIAEYEATWWERKAESVPVVLVLAVIWFINQWPGRGGSA